MKEKKKLLILLALSLFGSIFLYETSLDYFFFQDDFFEINISQAANIGEYLKFYLFRSDIIAYRPISLQNYFFFSHSFFGLNPIGFRLISFVFFLSSSYLIIKVTKIITKSRTAALLTASFWLLSSIHYMALTWIAAAYNVIGTFFWLLTSFFFLKFTRESKKINYFLSIFIFLITVGSFEFSVTWPIVWSAYYLIFLKRSVSNILKVFAPFLILSLIYLALRTLFVKVPQIFEYNVSLDFESLKAFFWYALWSFNVPEEFKKQISHNLIILRPKFLEDYWLLVTISLISLVIIVTLSIIYPMIKISKNALKINFKKLLFSLIWFCVAISPVLLLPNHTFTMYLTLASIGIYMFLAILLTSQKSSLLILLVLTIWTMSSYFTLSFYKTNSWMVEAQRFASGFASNTKNQNPYFPKQSVVLYDGLSQRHRQALLENHALRAIYRDQTLDIYYNKEDLLKNFRESKIKSPIYIYIPQ